MIFPKDPAQVVRHPSQLYQMMLEGVLLFAILFWFSRKPRPRGVVSGLFLVCYGVFRFVVEFVREPDEHLQFVSFGWMTRGQQLSVPMILFGIGLIYWGYKNKVYAPPGIQSDGSERAEAKEPDESKTAIPEKNDDKKKRPAKPRAGTKRKKKNE
jgi:phosphatidylglycerol:prolipoprotein diacylglycerol transferase